MNPAPQVQRDIRPGLLLWILWCCVIVALPAGCDLTPRRPDAVFIQYRDRMKSDNVDAARSLLTEPSRNLVLEISKNYQLKQAPEYLAYLNVLDPSAPPVTAREEENMAVLQIRTLRGGHRFIKIVRADSRAPWQIDVVDDLKALQGFLDTRFALDMLREQAGEYAAMWKAFDNQLSRMNVAESTEARPPAPPKPAPPRTPPKPRR